MEMIHLEHPTTLLSLPIYIRKYHPHPNLLQEALELRHVGVFLQTRTDGGLRCLQLPQQKLSIGLAVVALHERWLEGYALLAVGLGIVQMA